MATRKSDTDTSQNPTPAKAKTTDSKKTAESYADQANKIATDARAFSEDARATLDDLVNRCRDLNQTDPGDDTAAVDSLRRLPMAVDDVAAALQALGQAAADAAARTIR